jgi:hypothetical protein
MPGLPPRSSPGEAAHNAGRSHLFPLDASFPRGDKRSCRVAKAISSRVIAVDRSADDSSECLINDQDLRLALAFILITRLAFRNCEQ